ncbi:hypothetical protein [Sulfitobacter sp. JB4-11]|uniref:hypothetical protein n=1 Tax=Sulfitobacter rhodophyticola TaxID=3238304 RepID=UPI00351597C1
MPRRIILHAGFHKTGTSTLQNTLRENRVRMKKHTALRLRWHMKELVSATRGYSTWRDPVTLDKVQTRFAALMDDLPGMPRRTLIVSAEELAGHLPGRGTLEDYSAAPILLYAYWEIARQRFPQAEIVIYLSTRAAEPWLESAYWQHVETSNMTMDFDAFRDRYHRAADLGGMVAEIASRVPAPVHHCALEDCKDRPLGPADPLLDLCDLPPDVRAALISAPVANARPDAQVRAALLDINRTQQNPNARRAAKDAILKSAGLS